MRKPTSWILAASALALAAAWWLGRAGTAIDTADAPQTANGTGQPAPPTTATGDPATGTATRTTLATHTATLRLPGRVLDRRTGHGVRGARVVLGKPAAPDHQATTDEQGRFALTLPAPPTNAGLLRFRISAAGYQDLASNLPWPTSDAAAAGTDPAVASAASPRVFFLQPDRVHTLRILTGTTPVAGATVAFHCLRTHRTLLERLSDDGGAVRVSARELGFCVGHPRRDPLALRVTATGFAPLLQWSVSLPSELHLAAAGEWCCQVVDAVHGTGVAGARVALRPGVHEASAAWHALPTRTADGAGRIRAPRVDVAARVYLVARVTAPGFVPEDFHLPIGAGQRRTLPAELRLTPAAESRTVQLIDAASGRVLARQAFELESFCRTIGRYRRFPGRTDERGCFDCPFQAGDRNHAWLRVAGFAPRRDPFPAPTAIDRQPWPVRLTAAHAGMVRIVDAAGWPVRGIQARQWYRRPDGSLDSRRLTVDERGHAHLDGDGLPTGTAVRVAVFELGPQRTFAPLLSGPIAIGAAPDRTRELVIQRGTLLQSIRVVDDGGRPAPGQRVVATLELEPAFGGPEFRPWTVSGVSDRDGHCAVTLPRFVSGVIGVAGRADTRLPISWPEVIAQRPIILTLGPAPDPGPARAQVAGRVLDAAGFALGGIKIFLTAEDPEVRTRHRYDYLLVTGPDGSFRTPLDGRRTYLLVIPATRHTDAAGRERRFATYRQPSVRGGDVLRITLLAPAPDK